MLANMNVYILTAVIIIFFLSNLSQILDVAFPLVISIVWLAFLLSVSIAGTLISLWITLYSEFHASNVPSSQCHGRVCDWHFLVILPGGYSDIFIHT